MSLPGAARAIGLGDIRVDSALNEPLSAQIDIVGATRDELAALTAKIANREVFQRHGADRPAFLSSATFKVGLDAQGRPVLNIRSSEAFTDPLVSLLVDLRWGKGELVREYSLLLDPAGFAPAAPPTDAASAPAVASAPDTDSPAAATAAASPAAITSAPAAEHAATGARAQEDASAPAARHRVTSRETLRAIARHSGARTEADIQRTMIALFRANPHAFDAGNINRLHLGAVLDLPTAADVAAIPASDARREVRAHMTAWRLDGRAAAVRRVAEQPAPAPAPTVSAASAAPAAPEAAPVAKQEPADTAIQDRLQTLQQELDDVHQQLAAEHTKIQDLKRASERTAAADTPETPSSSTVQAAESTPATPGADGTPARTGARSFIGALAAGIGLLLAGMVYWRRRKPAIQRHPYDVIADQEQLAKLAAAVDAADSPAVAAADPALRPLDTEKPAAARAAPAAAAAEKAAPVAPNETTVSLAVDAEALERSYLDSLAVDSLGIDTSVLESAGHDTVEHNLSDIRGAAEHDPIIVDPSTADTAEHDATGLETVAIDASDLDAEIDNEALNTAVLDVEAFKKGAGRTELDYNLLDLDATGQHVEMPSKLHDRVEVSERRTNIADVLKAAIERDPYRRDLRMKLLETYYSAASLNQRAFMEIVRKAARDQKFLSAEDWAKVREMGREIAGDDPLFEGPAPDGDLADCA